MDLAGTCFMEDAKIPAGIDGANRIPRNSAIAVMDHFGD
jgi:hypothetical protein